MTKPKPRGRRVRFVVSANRRTNTLLAALRGLGRLGDRSKYEYSTADVETIFAAVLDSVDAARKRFDDDTPLKFRLEEPGDK